MDANTSYSFWKQNVSTYLTWIVIAVVMVYAFTAAVRSVSNTLAANGNVDFHSYWYDGVLMRYGINTFERFLNKTPPPAVEYIGGIKDNIPTVNKLNIAPADPALGIIIFSIFGNFHWPVSKVLWLIVNIIATTSIPLLILRLLPSQPAVKLETKLLIALTFFILLPVRNAIGNGQSTVLTLCLMLLAILIARRSEWLAGLALAGALVKFSVGAPLVFFFLYFRRCKPVLMAGLLHLAGIVIYSLATTTPIDVLIDQHIGVLLLWRFEIGDQGIALTSLFPPSSPLASMALLITSVILIFTLLRCYFLIQRLRSSALSLVSLAIFSAMTLYITLVIYHSYYDSLIIGLFFALLIYVLSLGTNPLRLSFTQKLLLQGFLLVGVVVFSIPGSVLSSIFEGEALTSWLKVVTLSATLCLLLAYLCLIWLINRLITIEISADSTDLDSQNV